MTASFGMPEMIATDNHTAGFAWVATTLDDLTTRARALGDVVRSAYEHGLGTDPAQPITVDQVVVVLDRAIWDAAVTTAVTPYPAPPPGIGDG